MKILKNIQDKAAFKMPSMLAVLDAAKQKKCPVFQQYEREYMIDFIKVLGGKQKYDAAIVPERFPDLVPQFAKICTLVYTDGEILWNGKLLCCLFYKNQTPTKWDFFWIEIED